MTKISRKDFLKLSAMATLAVPSTVYGNFKSAIIDDGGIENTPYYLHPGLQVYTLRESFNENPIETLKRIAQIGYKELEFYDPRSLSLVNEVKDMGMSIISTHFPSGYISGVWDPRFFKSPPEGSFDSLIELCSNSGIKNLGIGYLSEAERESLDDYKLFAEKANIAGEKAQKAGIQLYYHNHSFEFAPSQGTTPFEVLLEIFDKDLVKIELDVFWVTISGNNASDWIKKLSSRIKFLHLKDMKRGTPKNINTVGVKPDSFSSLGDGTLDFQSILTTANECNIPYTFVEQDHSSIDPFESVSKSLKYLQDLKL